MTILFDSAIGNVINTKPKRFRALASRPGVFPYLMGGKLLWQYRPEEEVYDQLSIDSLLDATITIGHPDNDLDPTETHGAIFDVEVVNDEGIYSDFLVLTDSALELAKNNSPVSPMYDVALREESGEYNGQRYDLIQSGIRYRSLGLVNKARQGDSVKVFLQLSKDSLSSAIATPDTDLIQIPIIQNFDSNTDMAKQLHIPANAPPPITIPVVTEQVSTPIETETIEKEEEVIDTAKINGDNIESDIKVDVKPESTLEVETSSGEKLNEPIAVINSDGGININRDYLDEVIDVASRAASLGIMSFNDAMHIGAASTWGLMRLVLSKSDITLNDYDDAQVAYKVYCQLNPMPNQGGVVTTATNTVGDSANRSLPAPITFPVISHPMHTHKPAVSETPTKKIITFDMLE